MEATLHLNEFFVEGGNQKVSHVILHLTEPSTAAERERGYFFAIAELNGAETRDIARLQTLIDSLENSFFELPLPAGGNALEAALARVNQENYAWRQDAPTLHCVVGAIREPLIAIATGGAPLALLCYKNRSGIYQRLNLAETSPAGSAAGNPPERPAIFSELIEGKLGPDDYLLLATPQVGLYFTADRLQKIITTRPARQSADHLQRVLRELQDSASFGGLILHLSASAAKGGPAAGNRVRSAASLENLFTTAERTKATLSASLLPKLRTLATKTFGAAAVFNLKAPAAADPHPAPTAAIRAPHLQTRLAGKATGPFTKKLTGERILAALVRMLQMLAQALWWGIRALFTALATLARGSVLLFFVITNLHRRRRPIVEAWSREWRGWREHLRGLPLFTKLAMLFAALAALILLGGLFTVRQARLNRLAAASQQEAANRLNLQLTAADSALIYQNDALAIQELTAAEATYASLNCRGRENKKTCEELWERLTALFARARKITAVAPIALTRWEGGAAFTRLFKIGNTLVALASSTPDIFTYNLTSRAAERRRTGLPRPPQSSALPKEQDYLALFTDDKKFWELLPADWSLKPLAINYPDPAGPASMLVYNRRLYSISAGSKQIYRHDRTTAGFTPGAPWLKLTPPALDSAIEMAIDGDVFLLTRAGEILKFSGGLAQPFTPLFNPGASAPRGLYTYTDLNYLYLLDAAPPRLIILAKDGRLKTQLTAPVFAAPAAFVVDEPNKTAYVVDGETLYKIDLPI
ncbi:MAG: hypothetical protein HYV42_03840 [Candidatus Magasanikbacteria bacterium]|nr:hypothetical protein [Candidatus Magasanikbacteria bacterium]